MTTVTNKNGIEFDIDAIATDLNNKVDLDGTNATYPYVVSRTANSQGGIVEIWSDGYCVQTGFVEIPQYTTNTNVTVNLTQPYTNGYYIAVSQCRDGGNNWAMAQGSNTGDYTSTSFKIYLHQTYSTGGVVATHYRNWRTEGYIR